jgi:hypothetical protein
VEFFGTPYFTTDTAGFAVIAAGHQTVDVQFSREYLAQPIVNASFSFEQDADLSEIEDEEVLAAMRAAQVTQAQNFLSEGISFAITNKSKFGFTIVLNKPATVDVKFSWTALAVRNASTFMSLAGQDESTAPDQGDQGNVAGDSTLGSGDSGSGEGQSGDTNNNSGTGNPPEDSSTSSGDSGGETSAEKPPLPEDPPPAP